MPKPKKTETAPETTNGERRDATIKALAGLLEKFGLPRSMISEAPALRPLLGKAAEYYDAARGPQALNVFGWTTAEEYEAALRRVLT